MDVKEPQTLTWNLYSVMTMLRVYLTELLLDDLQVMLYQNPVTILPETSMAELIEANFGNYSRGDIASWSDVYKDSVGNSYALAPLHIFSCDGSSGNTIYGMAIVAGNGGDQATATNPGNSGAYDAGFVITDGGTDYTAAPRVRLTGATGSGATAHSVITNGVVTSIVLDTPGSGYTTFTVELDPPMNLIEAGNFPTPITMTDATDALAVVPELAIPPLSVS